MKQSLKEGRLSNIQGTISSMVSTVGNLIIMYCGIMQVINNEITLGTLIAFMTLSEYFLDPVGRLVGLQLDIQEAGISMKRMAEILDYEQEQSYQVPNEKDSLGTFRQFETEHSVSKLYQEIDRLNGNIEIKDVTFRYGNRKPALSHVSFTIPKGKKVALVGLVEVGNATEKLSEERYKREIMYR